VNSDIADYDQVLRLAAAGTGTLENSVPEPAGILLIGLGGMIMLLLRRGIDWPDNSSNQRIYPLHNAYNN